MAPPHGVLTADLRWAWAAFICHQSGAVPGVGSLAVVQPGPAGLAVKSPGAELAVRRFGHDGEPAKGAPRPSADERAQGQGVFGLGERERDYLLAWVGENMTQVRRSASGQRVFYWILGIGFVVGLAAHIGGFLLKTSVTTEPLLLVADLLYALGWALWTSVVVVLFVQIWPEVKKRQYKQALDVYEAAVGRQAQSGSGQDGDPASAENAP